MLKTCSGGHDRCTFQGPGSGSYHVDGMNSSISKGNSLKTMYKYVQKKRFLG